MVLNLQTPISENTRASDKTATQAGLTNISIKVFNSQGDAVTEVSQVSSDEGFGNISVQVPIGSYSFVAVANSKSAPANINSTTLATIPASSGTVYSKVQSVTLTSSSDQVVNMELDTRKNSAFRLKISDPTPADVAKLQLIVSPTKPSVSSLTFNPTTGLETTQKCYEKTFSRSDISQDTFTDIFFSVNCMLTQSVETLDVQVNALSSADQVIYTKTITGVTFKQGQYSTGSGRFFSSSATGGLLFDTSMPDNPFSLN